MNSMVVVNVVHGCSWTGNLSRMYSCDSEKEAFGIEKGWMSTLKFISTIIFKIFCMNMSLKL